MGQATRGHSQGPQCPVLASRTATKKEEKMERKDEKKPEDGKKEKEQAELRAGPAERSRATASGERLGGREAQSRGAPDDGRWGRTRALGIRGPRGLGT